MSCSGSADRHHRTVGQLGHGGFRRLRGSRVAVIGLGGVGAHAAIALARSGIGHMLLVDFDLVTESSLNRNPLLGPGDVGLPKADVMADHLLRDCPDTGSKARREFFHHDTADLILQPAPDLVVDAIDSLNPKVALIEECLRRGVPVVSSMGASGRTDPSAVRVGDLMDSRCCPLARQVRKRLRKRGIDRGTRAVWSVEPDRSRPMGLDGSERTLDRGRARNTLPSLITMPGIFGYACAAEAIAMLCGEE